jgi:hypothetical protein
MALGYGSRRTTDDADTVIPAETAKEIPYVNLADLLEQQAMALPVDERKKLGAKLLASVSAAQPAPKRRAGSASGRVHMAPDFDAPLDDFAEYA